MLKISLGSRRHRARGVSSMPALLATTSLAALLFGGTAHAANITVVGQNPATVTNPIGNTTDFVLVEDSVVTNSVLNAGTINVGNKITVNNTNLFDGLEVVGSTVGTVPFSLTNATGTGTIAITTTGADSLELIAVSNDGIISNIAGVANGGTLTGTAANGNAVGIFLGGGVIVTSGGILNDTLGKMNITSTGGSANAITFSGQVHGDVLNKGTITVNSGNVGSGISSTGSVSGNVSNTGSIATTSTNGSARGIVMGFTVTTVAHPGTVAGNVTNTGTLNLTGGQDATGMELAGNGVIGGTFANENTITLTPNTVGGNIGDAIGIFAAGKVGNGVSNAAGASINATGGINSFGLEIFGGNITNGVSNSGTITLTQAKNMSAGIAVFSNTRLGHTASSVKGGVTNSGTINLSGAKSATGILASQSTISDTGISNTKTIMVTGGLDSFGIQALAVNVAAGGVMNSGTITLSSSQNVAVGINVAAVAATPAATPVGSTISGGVMNSGTITLSGANTLVGILASQSTISDTGISNTKTLMATGGILSFGIDALGVNVAAGGVMNSGTITLSQSHQAFGINVAGVTAATQVGSTISGGVTNSGTINLSTAVGGPAIGISTRNSNVTSGGVSNTKTITAAGGDTGIGILTSGSTVTGGVSNSGAITASGSNQAAGLVVTDSNVTGGITNTSTGNITTTANVFNSSVGRGSTGIEVSSSQIAGGITNAGMINAVNGIVVLGGSVAGGVSNAGAITATGGANSFGIETLGGNVTGGVANSGTITLSGAQKQAVGIALNPLTSPNSTGTGSTTTPGTVSGGVANSGSINVSGATQVAGIAVNFSTVTDGGVSNTNAIIANGANTGAGIALNNGTVAGGLSNSGSITASGALNAVGIAVAAGTVTSNGITNTSTGTISVSGGNTGVGIVVMNGAVAGGVSNAGAMTATSGSTAFGIEIVDSAVTGAISNSGTITATGKTIGIGIAVSGNSPISGGITNTGNITGSTAAISLAGETGVSNTVTQAGGTLAGSIIGSGNTKGDVLNLTGGQIVLQANQSISGFGTYNQTGGTLVFNVTQSTTPGTYPTLSANAINLKGGSLVLVPGGNLAALAAQGTTVYKNAILADPPLTGNFASVTTPDLLFTAGTSPDATTPNSLDATLTFNKQAVVVSAQDLTQDLRLALDAPRVLTEAVQDRLVASGGALGEWSLPGAPSAGGTGTLPIGQASVWARGFDQFGSASASASSGAVGYGINRAAPLIGGIDWRLGNGIVTGVAATYVASSASFKDGSRTNLSSYQGAAYAGWAGGPWYALASAVVSFNDFGTSRLLTPFGLPGDAASKPSGQSYQGHAEAGYHWVLPAGGTNVSVTPYAAVDYVDARIGSFNETGGFGAFSVNAADSSSFQTTLGARVTTRIDWGNQGVLLPELRIGWNHEFLDTSQTIVTTLIGVPGSLTSTTGINFGRDSATVGAGVSLELSPDAKVFLDYDGKFSQRLQEHSISGGLRVKF